MQRLTTILAVLSMLAFPAAATAQACLGIPVHERGFALGGTAAFTEGSQSFGAGVQANLAGPLTATAGYRLTTYEDVGPNGHGFSGKLAYELPVEGASICPSAGVSYQRVSETEEVVTGSVSQTIVPIGLGIGRTFVSETGSMGVTLSATPQFLYLRTSVSVSGGEGSLSVSDSMNEFGAELSAVINSGSLYFGAGAAFTTIEDSDPVFLLGVGVMTGR